MKYLDMVEEMGINYDEGNRMLNMGELDFDYYDSGHLTAMVDGPNMYMYVRNDPVNFRDPSGRWNPGWGNPMLINARGHIGDPCPNDWFYDSVEHCMSYGHSYQDCVDICFGTWTGGDGVEIPEWVICVVANLGLSMANNPGAYTLCATALSACGVLVVPILIAGCAVAGCAFAAGEIYMAIEPCI